MNAAHIHLILNHVPVIGTVLVVPLLAFAFMLENLILTRVGLWALIGLGVVAGVVYLTGEPAEELVAQLPGVTEAMIERHEEAAAVSTALLGGVAAVAIGGLIALFKRGSGLQGRLSKWMLLLSLLPAAAMGYTAYLGGQIRHPEIRAGAEAPATAPRE